MGGAGQVVLFTPQPEARTACLCICRWWTEQVHGQPASAFVGGGCSWSVGGAAQVMDRAGAWTACLCICTPQELKGQSLWTRDSLRNYCYTVWSN